MKTLIAYSSTHGSAAECARFLAGILGDTDVVDLKKGDANPAGFDAVILGSSVYGGQIQKEVKDFCKKYLGILLQKPIGIYLTCLTEERDEIRQFLENGFPSEIVGRLTAFCTPGGAIYFTKMNFLERNASKILLNGISKSKGAGKITDGKTDYVTLSKEKLEAFARRMAGNQERNPS
ncbi:flavodoxin domain-containing protein [Caproicibacter sp.]|uniref:flavodoxin domain-containing protein n=1 Tax=Caproicibacter sp. TaxID=2814884 RepID=UPI00398A1A30